MGKAKAFADEEAVGEEFLYLSGPGIGGHIKVFGSFAQEEIADRTTHQICLETIAGKSVEHLQCIRIDIFPGYAVR
jgi:hypothetical protein